MALFVITLLKVRDSKGFAVNINEFLSCDTHMQNIRQKVNCDICLLKKIKPFLIQNKFISLCDS